ncbi:MAG TPA: SUMF1/EgtB/PvdO family nonheme iron enzyme [Polyangiaceae bacterium]|nr:SUMF1/EgtB/PvdO family nonheme iron enzyme [Polyangiaceae bacterium]
MTPARRSWRILTLLLTIAACQAEEAKTSSPEDDADNAKLVTGRSPSISSTSSSTSLPSPPPEASKKSCPVGRVRIEGGVFRMGAPYAVHPQDDAYLHEVALRSFCLDRHEVTVAAYRECVRRGDCEEPFHNNFSCTWDLPERDNHPINCVDFSRAQRACLAMGKRLPTEEEWEYAARGGSENRTYSWGESAPSGKLSCYNHRETCPVDAHPAGAFGLLGMTGNVWEWTSSSFVKYAGWVPAGQWRVYRGGSYSRRFPKWMKTWVRNRFRPEQWGAHLGFRCAADLSGAVCPAHTTPLENDPTRCLHPNESIPRPPPTEAGPIADDAPPPVVTRSPSFDEDCQRFKPSTPHAYDIRGSSFAQRQKETAKRGCSNRDVGAKFNSVCCP